MISKFRNFVLLVILIMVTSSVYADFDIVQIGDNCPNNLQLMPAGVEVEYSPQMMIGQISNGYVDPSVVSNMHSYFFNMFQQELPVSSLLASLPPGFDILQEEAPVPMTLTGNYHCMFDGVYLVMREAQTVNQTGWVIESIIIEDLFITDDIVDMFTLEVIEPLQEAPNPNNTMNYAPIPLIDSLGYQAPDDNDPQVVLAPDTIPILSGSKFNFWVLDVPPLDLPDTLAAPELSPQAQYLCGEYTAPSYLSVGMQAEMDGYQYARFATLGDLSDGSNNNWLDLGEATSESAYTFNVFSDLLNSTNIVTEPITSDENGFANQPATIADTATIFAPPVYGAPIVTILSGPFCGEQETMDNHPCPENGVCEWTAPVFEHFATWWQIEVTIHGETYVGWYPENVTEYGWWLWESNGIFDQVSTAYLLQPLAAETASSASCDTLPTSRFVVGMDVQVALGDMNVRDDVNGNIIGRATSSDRMTLVGETICQDGLRWREVIFHSGPVGGGWIAENDASVFYLTPYQVPVELTPVPSDSTSQDDSRAEQATPQYVQPQATPEPASVVPQATSEPASIVPQATPEPTRVVPQVTIEPTRVAPQATPITVEVRINPSCDPATGRGC